jgi:hypothetical protein
MPLLGISSVLKMSHTTSEPDKSIPPEIDCQHNHPNDDYLSLVLAHLFMRLH